MRKTKKLEKTQHKLTKTKFRAHGGLAWLSAWVAEAGWMLGWLVRHGLVLCFAVSQVLFVCFHWYDASCVFDCFTQCFLLFMSRITEAGCVPGASRLKRV